jgi:hypothetical protein
MRPLNYGGEPEGPRGPGWLLHRSLNQFGTEINPEVKVIRFVRDEDVYQRSSSRIDIIRHNSKRRERSCLIIIMYSPALILVLRVRVRGQ